MTLIEKIFGKRQKSADIARERLQIILAHERSGRNGGSTPDYLPALQRELVEVISKYVAINQDDIKVQLERQDNFEVLEVNIVLPEKNR
jgi:cell division topological specificity factor